MLDVRMIMNYARIHPVRLKKKCEKEKKEIVSKPPLQHGQDNTTSAPITLM